MDVSSTETPVVLNDALRSSESGNCKIRKCHLEKQSNTQNEVDLQDVKVPAICVETSDEDDASEDDEPTTPGSSINCGKEFASALHERTQKLWLEMTSLQEKLNREMALWRREKAEFQLLRERNDAFAFEEATAAARAAAAAYAIESPLSNDLDNIVDITSEQSFRELAILEYEKNLAKYHDRHSFEQAEQRYNSYKRLIVDAYRQKLSEVERLCNEELENMQQKVSCLQPFKEIASQWSIDENGHGDSQHSRDNPQGSAESSKITKATSSDDWSSHGKVDDEVNMIPEILSARFTREEAI